MSISNFDYKILKFVSNSQDEVVMQDIINKFSDAGKQAAINLCSSKLLYWCYNDDCWHDYSCRVVMTDHGKLALAEYKYDKQLKNAELWRERIISYILGIATSATVWIITEYLIPSLSK